MVVRRAQQRGGFCVRTPSAMLLLMCLYTSGEPPTAEGLVDTLPQADNFHDESMLRPVQQSRSRAPVTTLAAGSIQRKLQSRQHFANPKELGELKSQGQLGPGVTTLLWEGTGEENKTPPQSTANMLGIANPETMYNQLQTSNGELSPDIVHLTQQRLQHRIGKETALRHGRSRSDYEKQRGHRSADMLPQLGPTAKSERKAFGDAALASTAAKTLRGDRAAFNTEELSHQKQQYGDATDQRKADVPGFSVVPAQSETPEGLWRKALYFHLWMNSDRAATKEAELRQRLGGSWTAAGAPSAIEEEGGGQLRRNLRTYVRHDVLFQSKKRLLLKRTATGNVVCLDGGVYGLAAANGLAGQSASENGSPPQVSVQLSPADASIRPSDSSDDPADLTKIAIPFASSVSNTEAAAAAQPGNTVVLLCTAPGQPLVALPPTNVKVLTKNAVEAKREDLQARAQCLRQAAGWRSTARRILWLRTIMKALFLMMLGTLVFSIVEVAWTRQAYLLKQQRLFEEMATRGPAALLEYARKEIEALSVVSDFQTPDIQVNRVLESGIRTAKQLRAMRSSVRKSVAAFQGAYYTGMVSLVVRAFGALVNRKSKKMERKRRLVLLGAPLNLVEFLSAQEESNPDGDTELDVYDTAAAGAPGSRGPVNVQQTPGPTGRGGVTSRGENKLHAFMKARRPYGEQQEIQPFYDLAMNPVTAKMMEDFITVILGEKSAQRSGSPKAASRDPKQAGDELFYRALAETQHHWSAASTLTPQQLKNYNVVLVMPDFSV